MCGQDAITVYQAPTLEIFIIIVKKSTQD